MIYSALLEITAYIDVLKKSCEKLRCGSSVMARGCARPLRLANGLCCLLFIVCGQSLRDFPRERAGFPERLGWSHAS